MLPFLHASEGGILMHDNAPPHTARLTKESFLVKALRCCLGRLCHPIENVMASMKTALRKLPVSNDCDELFRRLVEIWNDIDALPAMISMRRSLLSTIDVDGNHTKY